MGEDGNERATKVVNEDESERTTKKCVWGGELQPRGPETGTRGREGRHSEEPLE